MSLVWKDPNAARSKKSPRAQVLRAPDGEERPCMCCQGLVGLRGRHPMDPTGEIFGDDHWPEPLPHELTTPSTHVRRVRRDPDAPRRAGKVPRPASNQVPLADICTAEKWNSKQVRQILRKLFPRPEGRWEFPPSQVEDVKKVIRDNYIA